MIYALDMAQDSVISTLAENIEREALLAWHEAACQLDAPDFDWRVVHIGDAMCSVSASEPSILINRVLGLGSQDEPTHDQLIEIRRLYRDAGIERFFLHVVPRLQNPETENLLATAGYENYRGWMKFTLDSKNASTATTDLDVRRIGPVEAENFAAIVAPAFDMTPICQPAIVSLVQAANWHLFMSFDGDRPAGTGAIFIHGDVAYTDFGATHPDFRCRGSQSAILSVRIQAALDAGCTHIVTMTGEAVPGDPQHSYANILKRGFCETYLRQNWIPAGVQSPSEYRDRYQTAQVTSCT